MIAVAAAGCAGYGAVPARTTRTRRDSTEAGENGVRWPLVQTPIDCRSHPAPGRTVPTPAATLHGATQPIRPPREETREG